MTIASDLLHQHIQTFVEDNAQWQTLIADDLLWELPYAPSLGHPARLKGRQEVVNHVTWFLEAVEDFPLLRCQHLPLCRFGSGSRRIQGRRAHQIYRAYLCPELRTISAGCGRKNRIPARIFRSRACGQGSGCPDSRSRILRTTGASRRDELPN